MVFGETERGCGCVAWNRLLPVRTRGRKIAKGSAKNSSYLPEEVADEGTKQDWSENPCRADHDVFVGICTVAESPGNVVLV